MGQARQKTETLQSRGNRRSALTRSLDGHGLYIRGIATQCAIFSGCDVNLEEGILLQCRFLHQSRAARPAECHCTQQFLSFLTLFIQKANAKIEVKREGKLSSLSP